MRAFMIVLLLAAAATAQEEKKVQPTPKNEQLIALLKEVRQSKDVLETVRTFADKHRNLDDETVAFIAQVKEYRIDTEMPRVQLYADYVQKFLKAKRQPEAIAALDVVEELYEREYQRLEGSTQYFGGAFLGGGFHAIGDWRVATGQKGKASLLYARAIACLKRRVHYDIANGNIKANEEAVKVLREKIAKLD